MMFILHYNNALDLQEQGLGFYSIKLQNDQQIRRKRNQERVIVSICPTIYLMKQQPTNFQHQNLSITKRSTYIIIAITTLVLYNHQKPLLLCH